MKKDRIEKMLVVAIKKIGEIRIPSTEGGVEKEIKFLDEDGNLYSNFSGYIDSLGPSIRSSGMLASVAFNEKNEKRKLVNKLLFEVIKESGSLQNTGIDFTDNDLFGFLLMNEDSPYRRFIEDVLFDAIVACKLAMRTFHKVKVEED